MGLPTNQGTDLIRPRLSAAVFGSLFSFLCFSGAMSQQASVQEQTHALIVVGLGGNAEYRDRFHSQAVALQKALTERHGIPAEYVTYLGERSETVPDLIADNST